MMQACNIGFWCGLLLFMAQAKDYSFKSHAQMLKPSVPVAPYGAMAKKARSTTKTRNGNRITKWVNPGKNAEADKGVIHLAMEIKKTTSSLISNIYNHIRLHPLAIHVGNGTAPPTKEASLQRMGAFTRPASTVKETSLVQNGTLFEDLPRVLGKQIQAPFHVEAPASRVRARSRPAKSTQSETASASGRPDHLFTFSQLNDQSKLQSNLLAEHIKSGRASGLFSFKSSKKTPSSLVKFKKFDPEHLIDEEDIPKSSEGLQPLTATLLEGAPLFPTLARRNDSLPRRRPKHFRRVNHANGNEVFTKQDTKATKSPMELLVSGVLLDPQMSLNTDANLIKKIGKWQNRGPVKTRLTLNSSTNARNGVCATCLRGSGGIDLTSSNSLTKTNQTYLRSENGLLFSLPDLPSPPGSRVNISAASSEAEGRLTEKKSPSLVERLGVLLTAMPKNTNSSHETPILFNTQLLAEGTRKMAASLEGILSNQATFSGSQPTQANFQSLYNDSFVCRRSGCGGNITANHNSNSSLEHVLSAASSSVATLFVNQSYVAAVEQSQADPLNGTGESNSPALTPIDEGTTRVRRYHESTDDYVDMHNHPWHEGENFYGPAHDEYHSIDEHGQRIDLGTEPALETHLHVRESPQYSNYAPHTEYNNVHHEPHFHQHHIRHEPHYHQHNLHEEPHYIHNENHFHDNHEDHYHQEPHYLHNEIHIHHDTTNMHDDEDDEGHSGGGFERERHQSRRFHHVRLHEPGEREQEHQLDGVTHERTGEDDELNNYDTGAGFFQLEENGGEVDITSLQNAGTKVHMGGGQFNIIRDPWRYHSAFAGLFHPHEDIGHYGGGSHPIGQFHQHFTYINNERNENHKVQNLVNNHHSHPQEHKEHHIEEHHDEHHGEHEHHGMHDHHHRHHHKHHDHDHDHDHDEDHDHHHHYEMHEEEENRGHNRGKLYPGADITEFAKSEDRGTPPEDNMREDRAPSIAGSRTPLPVELVNVASGDGAAKREQIKSAWDLGLVDDLKKDFITISGDDESIRRELDTSMRIRKESNDFRQHGFKNLKDFSADGAGEGELESRSLAKHVNFDGDQETSGEHVQNIQTYHVNPATQADRHLVPELEELIGPLVKKHQVQRVNDDPEETSLSIDGKSIGTEDQGKASKRDTLPSGKRDSYMDPDDASPADAWRPEFIHEEIMKSHANAHEDQSEMKKQNFWNPFSSPDRLLFNGVHQNEHSGKTYPSHAIHGFSTYNGDDSKTLSKSNDSLHFPDKMLTTWRTLKPEHSRRSYRMLERRSTSEINGSSKQIDLISTETLAQKLKKAFFRVT